MGHVFKTMLEIHKQLKTTQFFGSQLDGIISETSAFNKMISLATHLERQWHDYTRHPLAVQFSVRASRIGCLGHSS